MAAAMERFVEVVKQYPGQQQVDLAVEIEVPGSWFGAGPMGSLTVTEQREKYKASLFNVKTVLIKGVCGAFNFSTTPPSVAGASPGMNASSSSRRSLNVSLR